MCNVRSVVFLYVKNVVTHEQGFTGPGGEGSKYETSSAILKVTLHKCLQCRHLHLEIFAHIEGGPSRGSCV